MDKCTVCAETPKLIITCGPIGKSALSTWHVCSQDCAMVLFMQLAAKFALVGRESDD